MGSEQFYFPPPPPPPPPSNYTASSPSPYDSFRGRGHGRGGAQHRGRGRGNSQRGYRGAGGNGPRPGSFHRGRGGQNSNAGNPQVANFQAPGLFRGSQNYRSTQSHQEGYGGVKYSQDSRMERATSNSHTGKRVYDTAFGDMQRHNAPAHRAPLPVPSFGAPLPSNPAAPIHATQKPGPQKKKHNQLGLTPRADEQDSSGTDEDVDEEEKLAHKTGELKVMYKGKTSTLQTTSDIQAWIQERKKRFPTMEKIEQVKREADEKKAALEAKRAEEATLRERKARELAEKKKLQQDKESEALDAAGVAVKARLKAEKLRKKLMKEEKRAAQAEAHAVNASKNTNISPNVSKISEKQEQSGEMLEPDMKSPDSSGGALGGASTSSELPTAPQRQNLDTLDDSNIGTGSFDDSSDETSSSGSDSSSSDSESDSDSAPEQATSRRLQPERVLPPPRQREKQTKKPCHQFLKTGKCQRSGCRLSHEVAEGQEKVRNVIGGQVKIPRNGLFQKLVARQKEEENRRIMQAISWLGEKGVFEAPVDGTAA